MSSMDSEAFISFASLLRRAAKASMSTDSPLSSSVLALAATLTMYSGALTRRLSTLEPLKTEQCESHLQLCGLTRILFDSCRLLF